MPERLRNEVIRYMDSRFQRINDAQKEDQNNTATENDAKSPILYLATVNDTSVKLTVNSLGELMADDDEFVLMIEQAESAKPDKQK